MRRMSCYRFKLFRQLLAWPLAFSLGLSGLPVYAQPSQDAAPQEQQAAPLIPNDQLDSLVAPIALYPDPLLAQVLAASTYPLEVIQLQQWLQSHQGLKDKALADAVEKENWDPSVQGLAPLPDVVKRLSEDIKWTTDLGNAFLAQQGDVMDAVQRMRMKAKGSGALTSNAQQKVETQVVENKTVVVIEQANPQVIYVPSYNPVVVYGPPVYPYPPIYYPTAGAVVATAAISFGVGMAMGAAWGGGWGYGCGWGHNNVNINVNNNYVNHYNRTNINNVNRNNINGGGNNWQHNPQHRGGAPYSNRATANKYGGTARGDSMATRQANARQNQGNRQQPSTTNRANASNRQQPSATNRANASNRQQPSATNRANASNRQQPSNMNRGGGGGADRIGNRNVPSGGGSSRGSGAFGGGSGGYSGSSARTSSTRGSSSMGARGGGSRGGGGRR